MRLVSAEEVDNALDDRALVEALRGMFRTGCDVPLRHHHNIPTPGVADGTLLLMPAWQSGDQIGIKLVTVFPDNGKAGLASILGNYLLLDGTTGQPQALLDGVQLTLRRTACASALAADYLARADAAKLVMVGAGSLAPYLIRAHKAVRPISSVTIWNHNGDKARALAENLSIDGVEITASADLEAAVRQADLVSCATLSSTPLVRGDWLPAGCHLDLVGAFRPDMRECDDRAAARARLYVDTREGALVEGGDIAIPLANSTINEDDIQGDLFDLTRGLVRGRVDGEDDDITLFKSVGTALEDLAAAKLVMQNL
ncbi:MAG: ornithine cyclodeaminase family protein [Rhodospirillaceae bacterium]|jgi:alanine dehydrogenase|nr:ornithine cyclodeaminase family protein [Rhodospirillaceae bacterium]MBT4491409.1 ornithine cyclodeaminase family protein [Rhodospirillaceae bacterium]MBT5195398.1 ornithine cyclodeaminase family protein [Rhodospirillaceae bacterium]MBT5898627.1 ornithine cyclodeaminase family protein [Rhodospirillaceae bacterium]MBT6429980.1 ornithine cyclodeaminase family protein [Rhodospirillaceae bacterium]